MTERRNRPLRYEDTMAARDAGPTITALREVYVVTPPVVYFIQRRPEGPVKIGTAQRLTDRFRDFYCGCPDPVIVRAVVPGGQAAEHWFHRRHSERQLFNEWYEDADTIAADALGIAGMHERAFSDLGGAITDIPLATTSVIRASDPFLADFERLYSAGRTMIEIAKLAGIPTWEARQTRDRMEAMGFHMPRRRVYASRSPRFDTTGAGRARYVS